MGRLLILYLCPQFLSLKTEILKITNFSYLYDSTLKDLLKVMVREETQELSWKLERVESELDSVKTELDVVKCENEALRKQQNTDTGKNRTRCGEM